MPTYLASHPEIGLTAQVEAPSTRKARTTYLDYLSRNQLIDWRTRQSYRENIPVKRIDPGEVDVDVELSYSDEGSEPPVTGTDTRGPAPSGIGSRRLGMLMVPQRSAPIAQTLRPSRASRLKDSIVPHGLRRGP